MSTIPKIVIKLTVTLEKEGFSFIETPWNCKESKKKLILTRADKYGEQTTRHAEKDSLFKVRLGTLETHCVSYSMLTSEEKLEESREILKEAVKKSVNSQMINLKLLINNF